MTPQRSTGRPIASVVRALALLDVLAAHPAGLGVNDLARRIGASPSTASRLLATLESGRLVERRPTGGYRLGLKMVALADGVLARLDVRELARPWLRTLVQRTGESATLSIPAEPDAVTVDFVPAESSVVSMARLGRPNRPHATATGKVMLAFGCTEIDARDRELTSFTESTIVDPVRLQEEIDAVRRRGWAEAVQEREPDLNALAAPVLDRDGELAAIMGLQGPSARLPAERRAEVLPVLLDAARELSAALGGREA